MSVKLLAMMIVAAAAALAGAVSAGEAGFAASLASAQTALDDGLPELSQRHAVRCLAVPAIDETQRVQAVLLLARSLHAQQKFDEMYFVLRPWTASMAAPLADKLNFWAAVAELETGRHEDALRRTAAFEVSFPESWLQPFALRLRAWAALKSGRRSEAWAAFSGIGLAGAPADPADGLEWAKALIQAGDLTAARAALAAPAGLPPVSRTALEARLLLARLYLEDDRPEPAYDLLAPVADDPATPDPMRGAVLVALAEIAEYRAESIAALALLERSLELVDDAGLRAEINLRRGVLLLRMDRVAEGTALVRGFVVTAAPATAAALQLQLARTLQGMGLHEEALVEFQNYIESFDDPAGVAQAWQDRGWSLVRLRRYVEAAAAFEKSAALTVTPAHQVDLWRKIGDCLFAAGQFRAAAAAYLQVAEIAPETPMAYESLLQAALCRRRQGLEQEAIDLLWRVIDNAGDEEPAARAFVKMGDIMQQGGFVPEARRIYRFVLDEGPAAVRGNALCQLGLTDYRQGEFAAALDKFTAVAGEYHDRPEGLLAEYMRGWCLYMLRDDAAAQAAFAALVENNPASPHAPDALFWLAEHEFNHAAYYMAETAFRQLTLDYPNAAMTDAAMFWAGRAALMQKEYRRANEYFAALIRNFPDSRKRPEARFYQGEALCEMGEFAAAIVVFDEIIRQFPDSYLAQLARFRKGDSQFTLGSENPRRYDEAIASYRVILDRTDVDPVDRLQAEYKIGRCLEKLGRRNAALEYYMNVLYGFENHPDVRTRGAVWFARAAFNAAAMMEEESSWRKAVSIYQRVVDSGVPAGRDAQERIRKIRLDHWMFFY